MAGGGEEREEAIGVKRNVQLSSLVQVDHSQDCLTFTDIRSHFLALLSDTCTCVSDEKGLPRSFSGMGQLIRRIVCLFVYLLLH